MAKKKNKATDDINLRNDEILREDTIDAALVEAGLDGTGSVKEKATRLEAHYLAAPEPDDWDKTPEGLAWHLTCEVSKNGCGYTSTGKQDYCVFCGDGMPADKTGEPSTALAKVEPEQHDGAIEGELLDDEAEGLPTRAGEPEGTAADLDEAVGVVKQKLAELAQGERSLTGNEWDVGRSLFDIYRKSLFIQRRKDGGAPLYSSWAQFCKAELKMSSSTANRYMRIAVNFPRELACDIGPAKLVELLPAAEAQSAEDSIAAKLGRDPKIILTPLLEQARVTDARDLRAQVKAAVPASSKGGKTGKATAAAAAKKNAVKKPENERVTVARQEGTVKLRFYMNEKAARESDSKKAAKKLVDGIVAVEPAVNGVECVYTLKIDAKGPLLSRKVVRVV